MRGVRVGHAWCSGGTLSVRGMHAAGMVHRGAWSAWGVHGTQGCSERVLHAWRIESTLFGACMMHARCTGVLGVRAACMVHSVWHVPVHGVHGLYGAHSARGVWCVACSTALCAVCVMCKGYMAHKGCGAQSAQSQLRVRALHAWCTANCACHSHCSPLSTAAPTSLLLSPHKP